MARVLWLIAAGIGAIKIRRRDDEPSTSSRVTRYLGAFIPAVFLQNALPGSHGHFLTGFSNFMSGAIGGMAIASVLLLALRRR